MRVVASNATVHAACPWEFVNMDNTQGFINALSLIILGQSLILWNYYFFCVPV